MRFKANRCIQMLCMSDLAGLFAAPRFQRTWNSSNFHRGAPKPSPQSTPFSISVPQPYASSAKLKVMLKHGVTLPRWRQLTQPPRHA